MSQVGCIFEWPTTFSGNIMMSWKLCTTGYISKEETQLYKNIFKGAQKPLLKTATHLKFNLAGIWPCIKDKEKMEK